MEPDNVSESTCLKEKHQPLVKVFRKRWVILFVYITYTTFSTAQWIQYSIIANVVVKYYGVSLSAVDWSSMVTMVAWPIFVIPSSFVVDKMGLRVAALIGATTTFLGAAIKVLSVGPDLYYVVMIGQTFTAISQVFILSLPSKIAGTWFPPEEASKVCALGIFGMTLGTALSFIVPPMMVKDSENLDDIAADLRIMCWSLAVFCAPAALAVFFYFPKQPEVPPSMAEYHSRQKKVDVSMTIFVKSIVQLMKNVPFLLHMVSYGCNFGIYSAFGTLLNQLVLSYFEGAQEDAGRMGMLMIVVGMLGTIVVGIILDKTRKFKESAIVVFALCAISMGGFLLALEMKLKWFCYLTISIFGIFLSAYLPVGFELAIELTYPLAESTVNGILLASSQVIAVVLTIVLGEVNVRYGAFYAILAQIGVFGFGTFTTCITPNKLKRQEAFKECDARKGEFEKVVEVNVT